MNLHRHIIITPSPQFTLEFTLGGVPFVSLIQGMMTRIHHYNIIQDVTTALEIPRALSVHLFSLPPSSRLATTGVFIASMVLPFPECHVTGESYCM